MALIGQSLIDGNAKINYLNDSFWWNNTTINSAVLSDIAQTLVFYNQPVQSRPKKKVIIELNCGLSSIMFLLEINDWNI